MSNYLEQSKYSLSRSPVELSLAVVSLFEACRQKTCLGGFRPGGACSKLTTSLVNVSLKFKTLVLQIHCYFLLDKCENLLQKILTFFHYK